MPQVTLKTTSGEDAGAFELSDAVFAAPQNEVVVREALNAFLANQRQGTHSTKTRGMVSGGGKKPWKQKHTGRARQGSIRAPQWRHGAIIFGPQPRDYREKVNRKKRRIALRAVLSARAAEGRLHVVDALDFSNEPKTRRVVEFLGQLGVEEGRVLFVTRANDEVLMRCARNLPYAEVTTATELNVYNLLVNDTLIFTREAAEFVGELFGEEDSASE